MGWSKFAPEGSQEMYCVGRPPDMRGKGLPQWLCVPLLLWCGTRAAVAQDIDVRTFVEWESFGKGAWKQVRVYRETFDETGKLASASTADAKTTLQEIDAKGFTLRVDVTVEVAGKQFTAQPQVAWYGFHGESKGQTVQAQHLGAEALDLNGAKLPTEVFQITIREGTLRRDVRAYCSEQYPHVLRKQSVLVDPSGEQEKELDRVMVEAVALNLPYRVLSELKSTAHLKTLHQRPDSHTLTWEVHCEEIPGRVVAHWSTKTDPATGRLLERSTLELVDFGLGTEPPLNPPMPRRPLFRRR